MTDFVFQKINIKMKKINYLGEIFFFSCLLGILYLWYKIYKPFLGIVLIAAAIASIFYPLYIKLLKKYRGMKPAAASFLMVMLISVSVITPLVLFLLYLSKQIFEWYAWLETVITEENIRLILATVNETTEKYFHFTIQEYNIISTISSFGAKFNSYIISAATAILTNSTQLISGLLFLLLTLFFMFRDGHKLLIKIMRLTPLYDRYDLEIYKKFTEVSYAALFATFMTALAQGLVGGIAYAILGLPVLFLALATAIASVIPFVGTLLVWSPLVIYFIVIGVWWKAIFMLLWGMIVIGLVDNIMRPWLMKGKTNIHPMILFFGIIGGIVTFGFWGIIYGPLIISIGLTLLHIYSLEYSSMIDENKFIWSKQRGKGVDINGKKKKIAKKVKVVEKKRGRGRPKKIKN